MQDMLVKLYDLPDPAPTLEALKTRGIFIRRAFAFEKRAVVQWVEQNFGDYWHNECDVSFIAGLAKCFVAVQEGKLLGFCCYDATCKNYLGPMGTDKAQRGTGIGKALLLAGLAAMAADGYAYAIIGGVGPADFYAKCANAIPIEGSDPGVYRNLLKP